MDEILGGRASSPCEQRRRPVETLSLSTTPLSSTSKNLFTRHRSNFPPKTAQQSTEKGPEPSAVGLKSKSNQISHTIDSSVTNFLPPKAFQKPQRFLGLNFGTWRLRARHFSIFTIIIISTVLPLYYVIVNFHLAGAIHLGAFEYDCYGTKEGWTYVGINLRFGRFDFGSAKALDLAWNWIVGRGLQGVLTLIAFRVFGDALLRVAERTPLSYELYAALSLYSNKLAILWQLANGVFKQGNWRTKAILAWLFVSVVYLVLVPRLVDVTFDGDTCADERLGSLMDACSGYESSYTGSFMWPNGTLQDVREMGDWQENPLIVTIDSICGKWYQITAAGDTSYTKSNFTYYNLTTSDLMSIYNWQDPLINKEWWEHFEKDPWTSQRSYWAEWDFFPARRDRYRCIAENNIYQWGFSYEWLFTVCILNCVWLIGLWILLVDCDFNSGFCKKGRRLGIWRAVADVSEAMREELGPNLCAYSESELADALATRPSVMYHATQEDAGEARNIELSSRSPETSFKLYWDREYG